MNFNIANCLVQTLGISAKLAMQASQLKKKPLLNNSSFILVYQQEKTNYEASQLHCILATLKHFMPAHESCVTVALRILPNIWLL